MRTVFTMDFQLLTRQAERAMDILLAAAQPPQGSIFVVGCSTSEILGQHIGSASSEEVASAVMDGLLPKARAAGLYMAVQGCEHINRSLCVERSCMEKFSLQEVWVKPWLHAGGAFVTQAFQRLSDGVMVEDLRAQAVLGMDIGGTMIGMHLRPVVVPMHTEIRTVGQAGLILARSRPKYVGGPRARYPEQLNAH